MPEKPGKNREQLKEITDRIEAGIRDIFESGDMEKYRNYLRTMSRFHNYSLNNQALIHLQRPDATLVAGYNRWRDKFSRHEEINLMSIYNADGTREGLIAALTEMRGYLDAEEAELRELTDSALAKLRDITDAEYAALDLTPDFDL